MTPSKLAKLLDKAAAIHEESYLVDRPRGFGRYTKDWYQTCKEAGIPFEWIGLIAPYAESGYCDLWDWVEEVRTPTLARKLSGLRKEPYWPWGTTPMVDSADDIKYSYVVYPQ